MTDAITSTLSRKIALNFARFALKSGMVSELKSALNGLPENGKKAAALRQEILNVLAEKDDTCEQIHEDAPASAVCVADGIGYEFRVAEFADVAFFRAARSGAIVSVTINSAHPFGSQITENSRLSDPLLMALLASWAHYELDQVSAKRQAVVGDARADWGRILRRLVTSSTGFAVNGVD